MNGAGAAGGFDPAPEGWRVVLVLALVGAALGFLWGIADQPRWSATATVAVESDSQGSDRARLERFAQRGESAEVARRAAVLLGRDVPGADLLADVSVRPAGRGGFLVVTATADAPDVAAAAADGFQRALVDIEGDPLAPGRAAAIPGAPSADRSAPLWALAGLLAGALVGVLVGAFVRLWERRYGLMPATVPAGSVDASPALLAGYLGVDLTTLSHGPGPIVTAGEGVLAVAPDAAIGVAGLADRLGVLDGAAPRSIVLTAVGARADAAGLAAALAVVAAEAGLRVLLVDADLAHPALAGRLGVEPAPGLQEYVDGRAGPRDVLRSIVVANGGELAVLPAGRAGPGARFDGSRFAALVERLGRVHDVVLYAAAPILGGGDAVIASVAEVVPVVGSGLTATDLEHAAALLGGSRVAVVATASG